MPRSTWVRRVRMIVLAVAGAALLAACSQPLVVEPAPYAGDPRCAEIMLGVPDVVGGLEMRPTSSQATTAYGDTAPIIVRCGVEPPGPSTDRCDLIDVDGIAQGWLISEEEDVWRAVAFGRTPAVEVQIPKLRADQAVGELLGYFNASAVRADVNGLECR
jgi:hypothetical protein